MQIDRDTIDMIVELKIDVRRYETSLEQIADLLWKFGAGELEKRKFIKEMENALDVAQYDGRF